MSSGEQKSSFRWLVLVILFLNTFLIYLAINCLPPLFKEIGEGMPLTKAQMGLIMGMLTVPAIIMSPLGGGLSDKIGARWTYGFCVLIIAIGAALRSAAGDAFFLAVCMAVLGIGMAAQAPNGIKAIAMWFPAGELAMVNGARMMAAPLALTVAMGTSAGILSPLLGGWRNVMLALGGITFIGGIFWIILFRDRKVETTVERKKQSMVDNFKKVLKVRDMRWAALYFAFGSLGITAVNALLPFTLSERGMTKAAAGAFVAIMTGANTICKIPGGLFSDKLGKRKPFIFICNIVMGICVITFSRLIGSSLMVSLALAGVAMACLSPIFMAMVVEMNGIGPPLAGSAVGLLFMVGSVFGFLGPVLTGKIMDVAGTQWPGFLFMGLTFLGAACSVLPIAETGQKKSKVMQS